ncbi:MAG: hypothetical protein HQK73_05480 [Desulfamplus sp.]|nr:hypothetical protein [Desulfamplus sp.]MBF0411848.1 hypothetical protein [Desulfamplus sp.]
MSDRNQVAPTECKYDDNDFHTWHLSGLEQCGSERYIKNNSTSFYSESFKVLYEQEKKEGSDKFVRIYGQEQEPSVKSKTDKSKVNLEDDDEFKPFTTGIAYFDQKMSERNLQPQAESHKKISDKIQSSNRSETDKTAPSETSPNEADFTEDENIDDNINLVPDGLRKRIFEDAYKNGFESGQTKGYDDGLTRGMEEGFQAGNEKGEQEGYEAGFQKGEQDGYDAGFQKGEEDGKLVGDAKALEIITSLEDILHKAEQSWQNSIRTHESKILSMICKIAEKIVFAKVELDEGIVKESILNALATMPEPEDIVLNISPDDYDYVEMIKDDFFAGVKSLKSVSVISNPSVARGGCKIESSKGNVETDIKTRLEQVFTSIMGARVA